jgi:uncharacterized protein (TIGR02594 family)
MKAVAEAIPWLVVARKLIGVSEVPGPRTAPALRDWATRLDLRFADDAVAWCGLFVAHCLDAALPDEPLPAQPLTARTWSRFGRACTPGMGAVMVFRRGAPGSWQGHVGFYVGEDAEAFHILGGNQADRVSIARLSRDRLLAARWPVSAGSASGAAVRSGRTGALSTAEA